MVRPAWHATLSFGSYALRSFTPGGLSAMRTAALPFFIDGGLSYSIAAGFAVESLLLGRLTRWLAPRHL